MEIRIGAETVSLRYRASVARTVPVTNGIDFREAATVFDDPLSTTFPDEGRETLAA